MNRLSYLARNAKEHNEEAMYKIIKNFEPKIQKSLKNTTSDYREDLSQIIQLKIIEALQTYDLDAAPTYSKFVDEIEHKK